jgi:hypothetical protein
VTKKDVAIISTYHGQEPSKKLMKRGQEKEKPVSVLDYNENMGGVYLKDQVLQPYLLERKKMTNWYMKMFRRLLSVTILSCSIICCANSGQSKIANFKFRVDLVQSLLIENGSEIERKVQGHHSSDKNVPQLLGRHFPERIPPRDKKGTVFWCPDCQAGLCVEGCFKTFHTKLQF